MSFGCSAQISLPFLQPLLLRGWMCNWAHPALTQTHLHVRIPESHSLFLQLICSAPSLAGIWGHWLCFVPFCCFSRSLAKGVGRSEAVELNEFPGKPSAAREAQQVSDQGLQDQVWDLHPKAKQLPQFHGLSWELALGKLWRWTWSQFLSHLRQGWTLQCRMSWRKNIPTLAEGWMQWSNHGLVHSWDYSLSCTETWQCLHIPPSNTAEPQPESLQMSSPSEKPGVCKRDLWTAAFVPSSMFREEADTTLGCRHTLGKPFL